MIALVRFKGKEEMAGERLLIPMGCSLHLPFASMLVRVRNHEKERPADGEKGRTYVVGLKICGTGSTKSNAMGE